MKNTKNEFAIKSMELALNILKNIGTDNALVSPVSILMAIGLAANGAEGATKDELLKAVDLDEDSLNVCIERLMERTDDDHQLRYANGIWVNGDDRIVKAYKKQMKAGYRAKIRSEEFFGKTADKINEFVYKSTDGQIDKLVDILSPSASMILINALSFNGKWDEPFEEYQIDEKAVFTTAEGKRKKVSMLNGSTNKYFEVEGGRGFLYPYENEKYTFAAILPDDGKSVDDIIGALNGNEIVNAITKAIHAQVDIGIPEFKQNFETELSDTFAKLGVKRAFALGEADFSGMLTESRGDYISQILHKTHIDLDREGTRAAAITGVMVLGAAPPIFGMNKKVILDRPFIYFILDNADKTPIFMGRADDIGL